jgi:hypothetical protein
MTSLAGVRLKIDRAKKHFADLDAAIRAFESRKPYGFVMEIDPHFGYEIYRFSEREAIPNEWAAIAGDCIHNLRSALDHLAVALVLHNSGTPTNYTAFPIGNDPADFESRVASRLAGANAEAIKLVRSFKPHGGGDNPIFALHQLDIADKHELLIPLGVAQKSFGFKHDIREPGTEHYPPARMLRGPPLDRKFPLKDGDVVGSYLRKTGTDIEDKSYFDFGFEIAMGHSEVLAGEPITPTLAQLIDFIERMVNIFATRVFKTG